MSVFIHTAKLWLVLQASTPSMFTAAVTMLRTIKSCNFTARVNFNEITKLAGRHQLGGINQFRWQNVFAKHLLSTY